MARGQSRGGALRMPVLRQCLIACGAAFTLFFGRLDFLSAYLIDQVFDRMRSLFIIGQISPDTLRQNHNQRAIIHVHPISSAHEFVGRVPNEKLLGSTVKSGS
jgi:hypothetical protein